MATERLCLLQVVDFHERDTDRDVLAVHDGGVISRRERCDDGALNIIRRRQTGGLNLGLLAVSPVVVKGDDRAISIMQLQCRIGQRIGNPKLCQTGPNGAHDYILLSAAGDDKAADHDIVTGLDKAASRNVSKHRGRGSSCWRRCWCRRWRWGRSRCRRGTRHRDRTYHSAALPMRGTVIRKRPRAVEGVRE